MEACDDGFEHEWGHHHNAVLDQIRAAEDQIECRISDSEATGKTIHFSNFPPISIRIEFRCIAWCHGGISIDVGHEEYEPNEVTTAVVSTIVDNLMDVAAGK